MLIIIGAKIQIPNKYADKDVFILAIDLYYNISNSSIKFFSIQYNLRHTKV